MIPIKLNSQYYEFLIDKIFSQSDNGIVISDPQNQIIAVNKAFTEIMGYAPEEIIGKGGKFLRSGRHSDAFYEEIWEQVQKGGTWEGELWVRRKNGEVFLEWLSLSAVKAEDGKLLCYLTIFSDITERKTTEERLHSLLHDDPLTGLPNRNTFHDLLATEMASTLARKKKLALLLVSLHAFRNINDSFGYVVGDSVLQQISGRLKGISEKTELIARIAGDEFALILPKVSYPEEAVEFAMKIFKALQAPMQIEGQEVVIDAYIGICLYPGDGENAAALIKAASTAMNVAKQSGRGNYQYFNSSIQKDVLDRLTLENKLRQALSKNEFVLYYQPVVNLHTGKVIGAEALVRWAHEGKMISPGEFIPMAEQSGIIIPMTEWIIDVVAKQIQVWETEKAPSLTIGVNITFKQFQQKDFLERFKKQQFQMKMNGHRLKIELTESIVMGDVDRSIELLQALKKMGFLISIDDFGTGYSSLSYLLRLPIDELKIDQSFVRGIEENNESKEIIKAIVSLAKSLKLSVLAEGVETKSQLQFLREQGCDEIQGFYFSKPVPLEVFNKILKDNITLKD